MTVVIDASFFVTLYDAEDVNYDAAVEWYERFDDDLVTTPTVVAEMDHMIRRYAPGHERLVAANLATRALEVEWWDGAVDTCWNIVDVRPDISLADASLVALAGHLGTTRIATFDERHFRTLKPLTGEDAFTLLPADAD